MNELLINKPIISIAATVIVYVISFYVSKYIKLPILPPIILSISIVSILIIILDIDYQAYNSGAKFLTYLITPATICLAIPIYRKRDVLQKNYSTILISICVGIISGCVSTFILVTYVFKLNSILLGSLLTKSITTPIAIEITENLGGIRSLAIVAVILSGISGGIAGPFICKIFNINSPFSKGIALGTASHAFGTIKALEIGETEGAMSSLALVVAGIISIVLIPILVKILILVFN